METRKSTYIFILLALSLATVEVAHAGQANIVNSVSVTASSGGSSASSGTVSEGSSSGYIKVYSEVNGQVVEDYEEKKESSSGELVEVHYENTISVATSTSEEYVEETTISSKATTGTEAERQIIKDGGTDGATGNAISETSSKQMYATESQEISQNTASTTFNVGSTEQVPKRTSAWGVFWNTFSFYIRTLFFF